MNIRTLCILSVLVVLAAGCTSTAPAFETGHDAEVTFDGLTRMQGTVMDVVWARKDIDLTGYKKLAFESLGVEYRAVTGPYSGRAGSTTMSMRRDRSTEFRLDARTKQLFEEVIHAAFLEEISRSDVFEIVDEPGPDTLLLRAGLLDVVSRVPPEPIGRSRVYIDSVGEATLVLELRDAMSNAIFVRAVDRRAARSRQMTESRPAANRAEVRRLGRTWGRILREALDTLLTQGVTP